MLRQDFSAALPWSEKTMTALQASMQETCEKQLAGFPSCALFDTQASDEDAERYYYCSYFPEESRFLAGSAPRRPSLHSVANLRKRVQALFPAEIALLSSEEHDLLIRLVLLGSPLPLTDWNDIPAACSLTRRLWCSLSLRGSAPPLLFLPDTLRIRALAALSADSYRRMRSTVETWFQTVDDVLYVMGMLQANAPMLELQEELRGTPAENHPQMILRAVYAGFDYWLDPVSSRRMFLLHPALAEPALMLSRGPEPFPGSTYMDFHSEYLTSALDSAQDLEQPLFDRMMGLIRDVIRPEINPDDAVEDLLYLAKQDVSVRDMTSVLSGCLLCHPSGDMVSALQDIFQRMPRWFHRSSSRLQ